MTQKDASDPGYDGERLAPREPARTPKPFSRRGRRTVGIAVAASLVVLGTATAASGVLSSEPTNEGANAPPPTAPPAPEPSVSGAILAEGSSPVAGRWRLIGSESKESSGQPAGLPCLDLVLTTPPDSSPIGASGFCGEPNKSGSMVGSLPVRDSSGRTELLIFGLAPNGAAAVELTSAGEQSRARTQRPANKDVQGAVWVMRIPPGVEDGDISVMDQNGQRLGPEQDASGAFDRLEAVKRMK